MENIKQQGSGSDTAPKKRGKLLTFLLILDFVLILWGLPYLFNPSALKEIYRFSMTWIEIWQVASYTIGITVLAGIFFWKRWAVYMFFVVGIMGLILDEVLWHTNLIQSSIKIPSVIGFPILLLWFIAIKRKWNLFR